MGFQLDLETAQLFVAVVEEDSVARAAERLRITHAAANKRLRDLEGRLGIGLLARSRRGVEPTLAGNTLLRRARALLYEIDQLEREMHDLALGAERMVRLCSAEAAAFGFLPGVLRRFLDANPRAQIDLIEALSNEVGRVVQQGAADIGVFTGVAQVGGLVLHTCYHDRLLVAVPPGHPLAGRGSVRFEEVVAHDMVAPDRRGATAALVLRAAAELGAVPRIAVRADGFDAVCQLVHHGFGAGLVPTPIFETLGRALGLVAVALDEPWARRRFRVCARDPGQLPVLARRLFDALVEAGEAEE
jgi:DNA-binding transcriptional LysR family regulator